MANALVAYLFVSKLPVRGKPHFLQRGLQAARLVDAGWQHHHRTLAEDDVMREPYLAQRDERGSFVRLPRGDDDAAAVAGTPAEPFCESGRRRLAESFSCEHEDDFVSPARPAASKAPLASHPQARHSRRKPTFRVT